MKTKSWFWSIDNSCPVDPGTTASSSTDIEFAITVADVIGTK